MIKPNAVSIDTKALGRFFLTAVSPYVKEGITIGYKYQVALPSLALEKFSVKIEGRQLIDIDGNIVEVVFEGLKVKPYVIDGTFGLTGTATGIKPANGNKSIMTS